MSEVEKFFKSLNEGRVVLVPASFTDGGQDDMSSPLVKFCDTYGAAYYPRGSVQVLILPERPDV